MIDEFHVMYMYKKIQVEAATTDIKTLEQLLKKFRSVVNERREEYYQEIGEKKSHKLKMKRLQRMLEKIACDRVSTDDLKELIFELFLTYIHGIDNHYCLLWLFIDR